MSPRRLCSLTYGLLIDGADQEQRDALDAALDGRGPDLSSLADVFGPEVIG